MSKRYDEPQRDPALTSLLREHLGAPPLRHEFDDELEARMTAADAARLPSTPDLDDQRRRRLPGRRMLALVAAIAAAAVLLVVLLPSPRGTPTATAADMLQSLNAGSGSAQIVRLHIVSGMATGTASAPGPAPAGEPAPISNKDTSSQVTLDVAGDAYATQTWWEGVSRQWMTRVWSYDERRREMRTDASDPGGLVIMRPAWATDVPSVSGSYIITYQAAASSLRALLAEADPESPVSEIRYLDRPAWHAELQGSRLGDKLSVTVDKATGLLVEMGYVVENGQGTATETTTLRVTRLEIDPQLPARWQLVAVPSTTTPKMKWISYRDEGIRFGTPEEIANRSWPTLPLVPQWTPAGYELSDVATAVYIDPRSHTRLLPEDYWRAVTVRRPGRLPGVNILRRSKLAACKQRVLVRFRRGFGSFVVEISPRLPGETAISAVDRADPSAQDVTLTGGYLKGARARTWISLAGATHLDITPGTVTGLSQGPTLLTYDDRSRITISGDLTRQELIDVANSLKAYGNVRKPLPPGFGQ
jgi:hypothetical protein